MQFFNSVLNNKKKIFFKQINKLKFIFSFFTTQELPKSPCVLLKINLIFGLKENYTKISLSKFWLIFYISIYLFISLMFNLFSTLHIFYLFLFFIMHIYFRILVLIHYILYLKLFLFLFFMVFYNILFDFNFYFIMKLKKMKKNLNHWKYCTLMK